MSSTHSERQAGGSKNGAKKSTRLLILPSLMVVNVTMYHCEPSGYVAFT